MAKGTGVTMTLSVTASSGSTNDISNDVTNFDWDTPRNSQDVTGLDASANERLLLLADFSININGVFNDAAGKSHETFKTIPSQTSTEETREVKIKVSGSTLPVNVVLTDYALTRAATGELTYRVPGSNQDSTAPTWG